MIIWRLSKRLGVILKNDSLILLGKRFALILNSRTSGFASRPWLVVPIVAAMHITYAVAFLFNDNVGHITALHLIHIMFGSLIWVVLLFVAAISILPMIREMKSKNVQLCLWPQQTILFLMTASVMSAAFMQSYPDGTERPFSFIYADQCFAVYLTIGHLAATLRNAWRGRYGNGRLY